MHIATRTRQFILAKKNNSFVGSFISASQEGTMTGPRFGDSRKSFLPTRNRHLPSIPGAVFLPTSFAGARVRCLENQKYDSFFRSQPQDHNRVCVLLIITIKQEKPTSTRCLTARSPENAQELGMWCSRYYDCYC